MRAGLSQLLFVVAGLAGGLAVTRVEIRPTAPTTRVFDVLMAVGFGVLSIAALIYSLLFVVVQWAAGNLTPRLNLFRDDPVVWRTFAYIVGVFVFCVTTALSIGRTETVSAVIPLVAVLLVIVAIMLIRRLQLKAFASIQLAPMLDAVTVQGMRTLRQLRPQTSTAAPMSERIDATVVWPGPGCVLQQLRLDYLVETAHRTGTVIVLRQQVGATLLPGTPLADIHGAAGIPHATVLAGVVTGLERTFGQDLLLSFRLLADIGLRALSPAVNDPATAVQALDRLHELFLPVTGHPPADNNLYGQDAAVRLQLALPTWEDYLRTGLDDVIDARRTSPLVRRRLRDLLIDLHQRATPDQRPGLQARSSLLGDD